MSTAFPLPVIVLGSLNMDIILRVPALPKPGDTILAESVTLAPGGKGANQAVAARRMGAETIMIGAVGDDPFGIALKAALAGDGIDCDRLAQLPDTPSGTATIAIDHTGENQILVANGANRRVDPELAARAPSERGVRLAQLETSLDAVEAFLRGGQADSIRILNAAPFDAAARPLFALCDIVIVNEGELAGFAGNGETVEAARHLIDRDGQTIIVTLGGEGAVAVTATEVIALPAYPTTVIDTTGAGDCFCGALAAMLAEGLPRREALDHALRAAALCVSRPAALPAMPFRAEL